MPEAQEPTLEKSLERLEEIVRLLEEGEADLEKSIELYAEGRRLGKACLERLERLETRIQLLRKSATGDMEPVDFEAPAGE